MLESLLAGDRLAISKALTLVESKKQEDIDRASQLMRGVLPHSGKALRLGITGAPGVGKSTFIEALGKEILKKQGNLAILSIDPSSPSSGGSILGDKTRMEELSRDDRVFVRPSPSGTESGGVAVNTRDQILILEAAGFEVIIVETVGVGQGETAASLMVDYLLLLMMPGSGDDLQGIKRGIMEVAHAFAITKCDMFDKASVNRSVSDLRLALHLLHENIPEIFVSSAVTQEGIDKIWVAVEEFNNSMKESGDWQITRREQDIAYFDTLLSRKILLEVMKDAKIKNLLDEMKGKIALKELTPMTAVEKMIQVYFNSDKNK